jgi:Calponin homology (CH) domain/EF hand
MSQQAEWERIQQKTFTNWTNMHLGKAGQPPITDLLTDFQNGVNLLTLLEVISGDPVPKHLPAEKCKMRIHNVENLNKALQFIADHDVKLAGVGAEEIVDGNKKMTLGMVWTIILRFAIAGLSEEGLSAKEGLLRWVQKKTEPYDNVNVKDFTNSWQDGLAFCALIHRHRPDLLPNYHDLSSENGLDNCNLAFDICNEHLDIPKLLDAEDIVNIAKPDERSIMTYVAQMYKVFSAMDNIEAAGNRLGKFINFAKVIADMMHDYETRANALVSAVTAKSEELAAGGVSDEFHACKADIAEFAEYKRTVRREWIAEQSDLESLLGNIQAKLASMNRERYAPPAHITTEAIEGSMEANHQAGTARIQQLNARLREVLDGLRQAFATPANAFFEQVRSIKAALHDAPADMQEQQSFFEGKIAELQELQGQLPAIGDAEAACNDANIDENEYTDHTTEDLQFESDNLLTVFGKKLDFLSSQIQAEQTSGVSAEQLQEFKESFDHFDENGNGTLSKNEFRSVMSAVGQIEISFDGADKKFDALFAQVSGGAEEVSFDQYIEYMKSVTEEAVDSTQAADAFETITGGKAFITRMDMQMAQLDAEYIEFLCTNLPPFEGVEDGYDYKTWLASQ